METILRVFQVFLALGLIGVVLLQRSEGGGLGIGSSGGMGSFMSVRGTANFLSRVTAVLAALFMITCLSLTLIAKPAQGPRSIFDTPAPSSPAPVAPQSQDLPVPGPVPATPAPVLTPAPVSSAPAPVVPAPLSTAPAPAAPAVVAPAPLQTAPAKPAQAVAPAQTAPAKPAKPVTPTPKKVLAPTAGGEPSKQ